MSSEKRRKSLLKNFPSMPAEFRKAVAMPSPEQLSKVLPTAFSNVGRPKPETFTYTYKSKDDVGKEYALVNHTRLMKAADTPFEPDVVRHLAGKEDSKNSPVVMRESVVHFPMINQDGQLVDVHAHFLHFQGRRNDALLPPSGEVIIGKRLKMQKDLAPGTVVNDKGEASIPPGSETQPAWMFSHYLPREFKKNEK